MAAIRRAVADDLEAVAAIQRRSPGAAEWKADDYLDHEFLVAEQEGHIVGFVVWRRVAPGEGEILNLAVAPDGRRKGFARELLKAALAGFQGAVFLEVRESNKGAQAFYNSFGFQSVSERMGYYDYPPETAIVMKFHSC